MKRLRIAIIGFGRVGKACAALLRDASDLQLAGVVERPELAHAPLPKPFDRVRVAGHIAEIADPQVALVCTPAGTVLDVAAALLQRNLPVVECAALEDRALAAQRHELDRLARHQGVPTIVGAGWEPGVVNLFERYFELLIPYGYTELTHRPGVNLHHSSAVADIEGVAGALCAEFKGADGRLQRYVYVELKEGAEFARVSAAIKSDPLFLGEETLTFAVDSLATLEREGHGVLLERRGTSRASVHEGLLLEGRFDPIAFTARIMLDAARQLSHHGPGAHLYRASRT